MATPEHNLQIMVTKFVRAFVPAPHFFTGIDRGQRTGRFSHVRQKARGLVSGTPDTLLLVPGLPAITIELKAPGGRLTEQQLRVGDAIQGAGHGWGWCDSVSGYARILDRLGIPLLQNWDLGAASHDATLASAAIRSEEKKTGRPSKARAPKPSAARIRKSVALQARIPH